MVAIATGVPSASVPVIAASAPAISGAAPRAESMSACVTAAKLSTGSRALSSNEGATIGSPGASSSPTPGSLTMPSIRASIWASPSGVSASPRKISVATMTSLESPKRSSISLIASATAFPVGRNARAVPSTTGARRPAPAASTTVTTTRTAIVSHGRTVTSQLSRGSIWLMARYSI